MGFHLALDVFEQVKIILTKVIMNFVGISIYMVFEVGFGHGYMVGEDSGKIISSGGVNIIKFSFEGWEKGIWG